MSTAKLSDAEVHERVIESIKSMTREEAQGWLDHLAEVFGHDESVSKSGRNGSHSKSAKKPKKSASNTAPELIAS